MTLPKVLINGAGFGFHCARGLEHLSADGQPTATRFLAHDKEGWLA